jgi:polysaccharide biosynthesis transport protein
MTSSTPIRDMVIPGKTASQSEDEIDLVQLFQPIWYRKWSILSLSLLVMMLATLVVLNITPVFQAVSTLLIEQRTNKLTTIEELYGLDTRSDEYLLTQFELLKSRELVEQVVDKLGLVNHPEFDPRQQEPSAFDPREWIKKLLTKPEDLVAPGPEDIRSEVVDAVMKQVTISPVRNTQLVKIKVDMADATMAAEAANALGKAYIQSQLAAKLEVSVTATSWMNEQLGELKHKLQQSEQRLQEFREQENLVDVKGVTTITENELSGTGTRLLDARRIRAELESEYRQVNAVPEGDWRRMASLPAVQQDPLIQEFRTAEAKARSKVEEFKGRYGPKYPKMISARTELDAASQNLKSQVAEVVRSIERKYQLALNNEQSLQASMDLNKGEIQEISRKEFGLRELEREVETNRQLYDTFLTRLKEAHASQDFDAVNGRIAERAVVPEEPIKPKKSLIVALSGLLALFAGVAIVWLNDMLNNTFKGTVDIENNLNLPVLGVVPLLKLQKDQSMVDVFDQDLDKGFSEAMRTLRTSVVFSSLERDNHQVILVTSSVPGEGKTTVSSNLALALSSMHKTLLIEADLRKPNLRKHFNLPAGIVGLANLLSGNAGVDEAIQVVNDELDLITAGVVPPNPQELISSRKYLDVMAELKRRYKYIIVDSPPTLAVSDAVVLSSSADSVLYVVKSLSTSITLAQKGVGSLLQKNASIAGAVLNQVDLKKADKYGYSYSGYYDYYGYSSSATQTS